MNTSTITLTISHSKPVSDLIDKVAGRAYTIDGVDDVTAAKEEPLSHALIRKAGGIVHSDGNIFFTNLDQLLNAIGRLPVKEMRDE